MQNINGTPFYRVFLQDTKKATGKNDDKSDRIDISSYVTNFTFEDCVGETDMINLGLKGVNIEFLEGIKAGQEIYFQFGYLGGVVSPFRTMKISDIDYSFGKTTDLTIKAFDGDMLMKKTQNKTVYQNKTASQIASIIADKYGLKKDIQPTKHIYKHLAQSNKTDWELLKSLVKKEKDGSLQFYIKDNTLVFKRLNLDKKSGAVFVLGEDIISFKPSFKDAQNDSAGAETSISSLDPLTKKINEINVGIDNAKDQTLLGKNSNATSESQEKNKVVYDANRKPIKK